MDDQNRPLAVLDFGFLTSAGDLRLDAAITASRHLAIYEALLPHQPDSDVNG